MSAASTRVVDPITMEVFRNRFDAIAQEMQNTLLQSAYSIILKEGADASCALFHHTGEVISQAASHPMHLAALIPAVERILREYPLKTMAEGDAYIMNDPYDGGTHIPDVIVVTPIFYSQRVVAFGCALAHQQDFGGKAPGSMVTDATEIFQEGLILPPLKLYDRGSLNTTLVRLIERNVRIPDQVIGDITAQVAAGKTASRRVQQLIDQYDEQTYSAVVPSLFDHAEELTRQEIAKIPDGTYRFEDYLDNDGIDLSTSIVIRASVTVSGSDVLVDFEGTGSQARGPVNTAPTGALGPVYYVMRAITGADIPNNSGCFRPIKVKIPKGSILNPRHPAPVSIRAHTLKRVVDVLFGALAPALIDRMPAASHGALLCMSMGGIDTATHRPFVYMECTAGGTGGANGYDGVDNMDSNVSNARNIPAESAELEYPVRIVRNSFRIDSGGAGQWRGGLGTERVVELLEGEVVVSHRNDRHFSYPWGLLGGHAGANWITTILRESGEQDVPARLTFTLHAGERIRALTGGGGGYGSPLLRDMQDVLTDVVNRKVSVAAAREVYGVVIAGAAIDEKATRWLREQLASEDLGRERLLIDRGAGKR